MLSVEHTSGVVVTVTVTVGTVVSVEDGTTEGEGGVATFPQADKMNIEVRVKADAMVSRMGFFMNIFQGK